MSSNHAGTLIKVTKQVQSMLTQRLHISVQARPHPQCQVSGDNTYICECNNWTMLALFDALGHGPEAHHTAKLLEGYLHELHGLPLTSIITILHKRLLSTRGAVIFLAAINPKEKTLQYVSLGNIEGRLVVSGKCRILPNQNGTLGVSIPPLKPVQLPWTNDSVLVLASDGISSAWSCADYPGLHTEDLENISCNILKKWGQNHDDATILIARNEI